MEVFFIDVAQGTCQIVLLGERRAIVIDCGIANDGLVLQFLKQKGVEHLELLIISHSHNDHIGGAVSVLSAYQDRISKICFVQDHQFLRSAFWKRIAHLYKSHRLTSEQLVRLEATDEPQIVWADGAKSQMLRTYSPTAIENLVAQDDATPNPTSAVLFLDVRGQRIIFAADSEIAQWQEINRKHGRRMKCEVLAVPHHAGRSHGNAEDLNWLFGKALEVGVAIISVGTTNKHGHPREDVVSTMTRHGTKVLCTQITSRCHAQLESLRPGVLRPQAFLGRSSAERDVTKSQYSRNVACAGTIRVMATDEGITVDRLNDHQRAVDQLPRSATHCPLCRISGVIS